MTLMCHSRPNIVFRVKQPYKLNCGVIGGAYHVDLRQMTCNCGRFQALYYLCAYAIMTCALKRIDCMTYIDEVYSLKRVYNVWKSKFPPIFDENMWPPTSHVYFELVPDKNSWCKLKSRSNSL
ncbi:hypothetical protein PVK06_002681 [Gossypium arboreum]|uniref:SWIM-type domain-containing protein n=1 Tax=Gossypium arboreum TaxID=29729 RepID=A0ABR0R4G1_GOSAR|nr:hypothetical protein PVK06_002681 [Gossypium arboreum]